MVVMLKSLDDDLIREAVRDAVVAGTEMAMVTSNKLGMCSLDREIDTSLGFTVTIGSKQIDMTPVLQTVAVEAIATYAYADSKPPGFWRRLGDAIIARINR